MDIKEMTVEQLKAQAYDYACEFNKIQQNIRILEAEIASRNKV